MDESEKMFNWGLGLVGFILILTATLQVCYRVQDKSRARVRAEIVETQQKLAAATATFSSLMRPEILRGVVVSVYPRSASIGFAKTVNINELSVISDQ
ncbi:MAG: hypothetical protein LBJ18_03080 [Rickettsiales bacterium]|jgi:hypothetical protein|nr:hypothetical protein [Rickettsiales bacterium]